MTVIYFIVALSILIIAHEWGHYIAARLCGIRVEEFSLGFGPKIFGRRSGDTEFRISLLPFGGYVKMSGQELSELDKSDEQAFYNQSVLKRACVVGTGPLMNLILCIVLMPLVFMIGKSEPAYMLDKPQVVKIQTASPASFAGIEEGDLFLKVGGKETPNWKAFLDEVLVSSGQTLRCEIKRDGQIIEREVEVTDMPGGQGGYIGVEPHLFVGNDPVIDKIKVGSPAEKAGLQPGDVVLAVNEHPIESWTDMVALISQNESSDMKDGKMVLEVKREKDKITVSISPEYDEKERRFLMGVSKDPTSLDIPMVEIRYGFFESIEKGFDEVGRLFAMTFRVLWKLVTLKLSVTTLGGPIKIAQVTAQAARSGIASFIFFLSFLSMQLGILNLLPIPVLDGGHLAFFGIEAIRRRPLSERVITIIQQLGMGLIVLLLLLVSINDLLQIEVIRSFVHRFF